MAGLDPEFRVIGIKIVDQGETPGLGANCTNKSFTSQFAGKTPEQLAVDKDGGPIKSLSGATITSRAIVASLAEEIEAIKADLAKKEEVAE
jgi:electron transport complex protein RnfG